MSRNPNQNHKKLDPLVREKHKRMVEAFEQRQRKAQRAEGLEVTITLIANLIRGNPFNQTLIQRELQGLAVLLKKEGYGRDEYMDAVLWIEEQCGFKLLPGTVN